MIGISSIVFDRDLSPLVLSIMKTTLTFILILTVCIYHADAFLPVSTPTATTTTARSSSVGGHGRGRGLGRPPNNLNNNLQRMLPWRPDPVNVQVVRYRDLSKTSVSASASSTSSQDPSSSSSSSPLPLQPPPFTHSQIQWRLRPPPPPPSQSQSKASSSLLSSFSLSSMKWKVRRMWLRLLANLIRLDCWVFRKEPPVVLCPKGGQAVLEAWVRIQDQDEDQDEAREGQKNNKLNFVSKLRKKIFGPKYTKVGRFGFTTVAGPPAEPIAETISDVYNITSGMQQFAGVAAIIYMFVEPPFRRRQLGQLALQVIGLIHSIQGCDFTVLVVDDNGSGKLVEWYKQNGYSMAPKLQSIMGSPDAKYGVTMIGPTNGVLPEDCRIQWW